MAGQDPGATLRAQPSVGHRPGSPWPRSHHQPRPALSVRHNVTFIGGGVEVGRAGHTVRWYNQRYVEAEVSETQRPADLTDEQILHRLGYAQELRRRLVAPATAGGVRLTRETLDPGGG